MNNDLFSMMCFSGEHKDKNLSQTAESSKAMENYCAICMFKVRNTWNTNTYFWLIKKILNYFIECEVSNNIFSSIQKGIEQGWVWWALTEAWTQWKSQEKWFK